MDAATRWERFKRMSVHDDELGVALDVSRIGTSPEALDGLSAPLRRALEEMRALEGGAIANPDEGRMVGHYWLRAPALAPTREMATAIESARDAVTGFAEAVRRGEHKPARRDRFQRVLHVGIGGSALGPQLVCDACGRGGLPVSFVDNTDPDGIDRLLSEMGDELEGTLTVVVSKSGGTKETRNGMLEVAAAYRARGLRFGDHAVAVTGRDSALDRHAAQEAFLARFPMWDWIGGRTSVTSAVGLLPAALAGVDVAALLDGARRMDELTRRDDPHENPAALLAGAWQLCTEGRAKRAMVVIPYKDALQLLARYLQQLVMESLGKRLDRQGRVVHQGLTVYGNKGSTDQHAYVQQLLDGPEDFFVILVEVLRDRQRRGDPLEVEPGVSTGDYLHGFVHGTRQALTERGRRSILLTLERLDAGALGALIALYERAVGLYASLVDVNAYHQPGVESGKRAAAAILELQRRAAELLRAHPGERFTAARVAESLGSDDVEAVLRVLWHLSANPHHGVARAPAAHPADATFSRA